MEYEGNLQKQHTAKERYLKLQSEREHYLDRAEECSELTIPSLIKPDGFTSSSELYNPFQSVGARGVNNLASKLLLLLLMSSKSWHGSLFFLGKIDCLSPNGESLM